MENRNSKKSITKDIQFLEEMRETLNKANTDITAYSHLKTLILDWKEELESIIEK